MKPTVRLVKQHNVVDYDLHIEFKGLHKTTFSIYYKVNISSEWSTSFVFDGPVWVTTDYDEMTRKIITDICHTKVSDKTRQGIVDALTEVIPKRIQVI